MSSSDVELHDILEEYERNSIRCALMSISSSASVSTKRTRIDPYKREMSMWIRSGMSVADAVRLLREKLGLEAKLHNCALVCKLGGSGQYTEVRLNITNDNKIDSVQFVSDD